ncbi:hypothetical protein C8R44DRAFT_730257 [Mycena epipterygia]|nr:hypothetical protein C8R44DRAFT_730257 [Mycena epipterygia]
MFLVWKWKDAQNVEGPLNITRPNSFDREPEIKLRTARCTKTEETGLEPTHVHDEILRPDSRSSTSEENSAAAFVQVGPPRGIFTELYPQKAKGNGTGKDALGPREACAGREGASGVGRGSIRVHGSSRALEVEEMRAIWPGISESQEESVLAKQTEDSAITLGRRS